MSDLNYNNMNRETPTSINSHCFAGNAAARIVINARKDYAGQRGFSQFQFASKRSQQQQQQQQSNDLDIIERSLASEHVEKEMRNLEYEAHKERMQNLRKLLDEIEEDNWKYPSTSSLTGV